MARRSGILVVAVLLVGGGTWYFAPAAPAASQPPTTRLVIEMTGGFAFVPTPKQNLLQVAYLNDVELRENGAPVCTVDQVGHRMRILRGQIKVVEHTKNQPAPATKEFDLDGAVVRFPALEKADMALAFDRHAWNTDPPSPGTPTNPDAEPDWHNLRFVPSILRNGQLAIRGDWKEVVNGWLELRGGRVTATFPSDPAMKKAQFEFRQNGTPQFTMSVTDKVVYTVNVPGTTIELRFGDKASEGYRRLVIAPQGNVVRLAVRGLHSTGAGMALGMTQELKDHCGFYSLIADDQRPPSSMWLRPFYISNQPLANGNPQPSPGFYCAPDWF